jgi:hypothetical protein
MGDSSILQPGSEKARRVMEKNIDRGEGDTGGILLLAIGQSLAPHHKANE